MTYKDKPIYRPSGEAHKGAISIIHEILFAATEMASQKIGCTGVSFVTSAIGVWAMELNELDRKSSAKFFKALSVIADPASSHAQKMAAEKRRQQAVEAIFKSVGLDIATEGATKQ